MSRYPLSPTVRCRIFPLPRLTIAGLTVAVLAAVVASEPSRATAEPVRWREDAAAARHEATRTDRPIFVYVGSEACGYCRKLERETWPDRHVSGILGQRFVPLYVDGHRSPGIARQLEVRAYPTVIALSPAGRLIGRVDGYRGPEEMRAFLVETLRRVRSSRELAEHVTR